MQPRGHLGHPHQGVDLAPTGGAQPRRLAGAPQVKVLQGCQPPDVGGHGLRHLIHLHLPPSLSAAHHADIPSVLIMGQSCLIMRKIPVTLTLLIMKLSIAFNICFAK